MYIIGDVHLGRKFTEGVPLHRKGDRERMVMQEFELLVNSCNEPLLVQTGDLFDSYTVDEAIVLWASRVVRRAAIGFPDRTFVFYRGNHDASKDENKASSFDVFRELLQDMTNVKVLVDPWGVQIEDKIYGFIPWHPFKSADDLANFLIKYNEGVTFDAVFGHWDVKDYGTTVHDFNMVPTKVLSSVTKTVYTGHVHKPCEFDRDGVRVHVVGSMQPYAHGEGGPEDTWYTTIAFDDYMREKDDKYSAYTYPHTNIRVLIKDGQVPEPCDCLSFTTKRVTEKAEGDETPDIDVQIADFNMDGLFQEALTECGVTSKVSEMVLARFKELRNVGN